MTVEQRARYEAMIADGQSPRLAEMLALRVFPGINGTDSAFMKGSHIQDSQMDMVRHHYAKEAGVDTNGKRYLASLARFPNDPEAWVSGTSDVLRICRDRGWNCDGLVRHEAPPPEPTPDLPIGEDILSAHVNACLAGYDEGERTPQLVADIEERVSQELTGEIDLSPEPRVEAYEDPFALDGMQPE